ncbi:MAG TPA: tetratricopeptide repeat protein [Planctomycetia bacterium]|nr:tetratricopeptide repeat protein [Planctomycetia bacterium]
MSERTESKDESAAAAEPAPPAGPAAAEQGSWIGPALAVVAICGALGGWWWWNRPADLEQARIYLDPALQLTYKAEPILKRYLRQHPGDPEASQMLARCCASRDDHEGAVRALRTISGDPDQRAEGLFRAGQTLAAGKRNRDAHAIWLEVLAMPTDAPGVANWQMECRRELASAYALQRRRADLWKLTEEMIAAAPPFERDAPLMIRAQYELSFIQPDAALKELTPALDVDPEDVQSKRAIARYEIERDKLAEARKTLAECVAANPGDVTALEDYCHALEKESDLQGLKAALAKAPKEERSANLAYFRSLIAEGADDDLPRAIEETRLALKLRSEPEFHHRLGQLLLRAKREDEGKRHLARSQKIQSSLVKVREAIEDFKARFNPADKRSATLAANMATALEQRERFEDALHWHRLAFSIDPTYAPSVAALERAAAERQAAETQAGG